MSEMMAYKTIVFETEDGKRQILQLAPHQLIRVGADGSLSCFNDEEIRDAIVDDLSAANIATALGSTANSFLRFDADNVVEMLTAAEVANLVMGDTANTLVSIDSSGAVELLPYANAAANIVSGMAANSFPIFTKAAELHRVIKANSETRSNTSTLAADSELTMNVAANEAWEAEFILKVNAPASADLKFRVSGPANSVADVLTFTDAGFADDAGAAVAYTVSNGSNVFLKIPAYIHNANTAGAFALTWAQNTANAAANCTIYSASTMIARKLSS